MTFEEILDQVLAMLQRRGRVSYRALMWQFVLDEATWKTSRKPSSLRTLRSLMKKAEAWSGPAMPAPYTTNSCIPSAPGTTCHTDSTRWRDCHPTSRITVPRRRTASAHRAVL